MTEPSQPSGAPVYDADDDWRAGVAVHPAADLFPLLDEDDLAALADDIRENGLRDPITRTADGAILDGRNRYRACLAAGVDPKFETYGGDEPWQFVVSRNLYRRHLTDTERAMTAGKIAAQPWGTNRFSSGLEGPYGPSTKVPTQPEAAAMFNVSERQVKRARAVHTHGTAALATSVENGEVPLTTAERWALGLTVDEQDEALAAVRAGERPSAVGVPAAPDLRTPAAPAAPVEPPKLVRRPAAERATQIRELADRHYTSRQIASALGITHERVWAVARDYDITVPADAVVGKTRRRLDAARVIGETVSSLEGTVMALALLEPGQISNVDPEDAAKWSSSLAESIKTLTRLRRELDRVRR